MIPRGRPRCQGLIAPSAYVGHSTAEKFFFFFSFWFACPAVHAGGRNRAGTYLRGVSSPPHSAGATRSFGSPLARICVASCTSLGVGLWDLEEVQEFFNMHDMEKGKSYAERAHAFGNGGLR